MTVIEDRPTLAENYARACETSHLELNPNERGAVDYIIAAGWVQDGLGVLLFRLRAEFDSIRADQRHAEANLAFAQALASRIKGEEARQYAQEVAEHAALTERALILIHLKSLAPAKQALGRFASILATREKYMKPDSAVMVIAGRALDWWLDPLCGTCNGTGAVGAFGEVRSICTSCHGSKLRQVRLAPDEAGHQFGKGLMNRMDSKCDFVAGKMRRFLAHGERA